ncbi:hypothetical protein DOTSEDRAFT_74265 [Dothistroma septosporum NZE10]|uniref:DNA-directed RNA polymerase n=1 Tax=Dothistroma septosporum (strain NZE10 / CBS 128990) TaxID=675120 RepID=N1PGJ0_DOTSN|nr:hypothetical protein DOTSEDRAFT_74265 [Dothistroma septosporum NZE10]
MLARSAGRRHQRRTSQLLSTSFAQLNLQWLAPAQLRWTTSQSSARLRQRSPSRTRKLSRISESHHQTRSLATAADHYSLGQGSHLPPLSYSNGFRNAEQDKHIPFDFAPRTPTQFPSLRAKHDPIVIDTSTAKPDELIKVSPGINGTVRELLTHLHTSLSVGRRDRAEVIIQRLVERRGTDAPESIYAHTALLEDLLKDLASHGRDSPQSQVVLKEMSKWFEVEIRNKGVQLDTKILVVMVRAAIRSLDGSRQDRSIRRYVDLAKAMGEDAVEEVLESDDYDDNEYVVLEKARQEFYAEPVAMGDDVAKEAALLTEFGQHLKREDTIDMENVPEVRSTEQKGTGLAGIKRAMETFADIPDLPAEAPFEAHRKQAHARQERLEKTSVDIAIDRWRKADEELKKIGIHTAMQSRPIGALMWQWYDSLLPALEKELEEVKKTLGESVLGTPGEHDRHTYGPYLELLPLKKVAANTILYTMAQMARGQRNSGDTWKEQEAALGQITVGLANAIEDECTADMSSKQQGRKSVQNARNPARLRKQALRSLQVAQKADSASKKKKGRSKETNQQILSQLEWPVSMKVKLGAMLTSKLIETAQLPVTREHPRTKQKITQMQPAFLHRMKWQKGKRVGMVTPNPALLVKMQSEPLGSLLAKRMPMVVEPKPWQGWKDGGYLHYSNDILRLPAGDKSGKDYFMAADRRKELDTVYKGLTALSKVPWKVNHDVFKVQLEAWNSGDAIANFAPLHPIISLPPEPDSSDAVARRKWLSEVKELENKKSGLHSKRCFQNFQLEIARTVLNETLYFPHNMDFRGRAYPIPPYLNHMGADNVRSLLTFAEGRELGENGLRWLKIHLATVAGHDKASMSERVAFTEEHLDDIYDSVRNPLDGRKWWLEAEDAWQTLAACFELTKALDSLDPTKFVSYLPVQQDGTCNGLQHYAALGGDKAGAKQVNLEPGDRPADVYTAVADAVKEEIERDAAAGNAIAQKLHGRLTRKCVKQPVMTNVYGVTFYGARAQVRKQLEDLFPEVHAHDTVNFGNMSHYVATKIFKSLGTMFTGAQAIQNWLGQCADRVSTCLTPEQIEQLENSKSGKVAAEPAKKKRRTKKEREAEAAAKEAGEGQVEDEASPAAMEKTKVTTNREADRYAAAKPLFKSTVVWTTPLRLPVVQPYRKSKSRIVTTSMQNLSLQEPQVWDPVSKRKQLQAFPPNFIHSLDATHMLLSALRCSENGMTFAMIHDSFWTHACDVNRMGEILRDAFIAMHSEDIIGRLREEFETRYKGCMYLASVNAGSPVGRKVTELRAQMKKDGTVKTQSNELGLEAERMRLVNSEDPEERSKGEKMLTPGSIVSCQLDQSAFDIPSEMNGQRLGEMPSDAADVEATNTNFDEFLLATSDTPADGLDLAGSEAAESLEASADEAENGVPAAAPTEGTLKSKAKTPRKLFVWLPLTFPEVPEKGDFDVRRLRQSRYFFH